MRSLGNACWAEPVSVQEICRRAQFEARLRKVWARTLLFRRQKKSFISLEIYDFAFGRVMMFRGREKDNFGSIHELNAMIDLMAL